MIFGALTDCYCLSPILMDERAHGLGFRCLKCGRSLPTPKAENQSFEEYLSTLLAARARYS